MKTRKSRSRARPQSRVERSGAVSVKLRRADKPVATRSAKRREDPFLTRESSTYEEPVPSREMILETLHAQGVPVSDIELAKLLHITDSEREGFERRLAAMQRDGQIIRNRRDAICVVTKLDLVTGKVQGHADGFGFLIRDDAGPKLFISRTKWRRN